MSLAGRVNVGQTLKDHDGPVETLEASAGGGFTPVGRDNDMAAFLKEASLLHLYDQLMAESLPDLMRRAAQDEEAFLNDYLKSYLGMASLSDRRILANALAREKRAK